MTWTKNSTSTLPATGNRTVILTTENGVQTIRYSVIDTDGVGHTTSVTLAAALAANPSIDAAVFAANVALIRAYCDGQCGFVDQ